MPLIVVVVSKMQIITSSFLEGPKTKSYQHIKRINNSLHVAVCPERVVEGNAIKEIAELPEIIGVDN
jgi:UDP-N-acetyl-D-mannosaminuronate dehydrogenase